MTNTTIKGAAAILLLTVLGGCDRTARDSGQADLEQVSPLVAEDVATQFGEDFEHAVLIQDRDAIHRFFAWERILDLAMKGATNADEEVMSSFREGARHSYEQRGLGAELTRLAAAGGTVRFLRSRESAGRRTALFRLTLPSGGGMNYCELVLAPADEGTCKAIDMHSFLSGERMSTIIRRMFLSAVSEESQALLKSASNAAEELTNLQQILKLTEASELGKAAKVREIYAELPAELRQERSFQLMHLRAAAQGAEEQYEQAIQEFQTRFPNDPALDMLMVDRHLADQQYEEALACLKRLEQAVGGDPYLDVQRAGVYVAKRDLDAAAAAVERAIERDENLEHAYWMSVTISLQTREFEETARVLELLQERFKLKFVDLGEITEYAEFVASPEYGAWQDRIAQRELERQARREGREFKPKPPTEAGVDDAEAESDGAGDDTPQPPEKPESEPSGAEPTEKPANAEALEKSDGTGQC